MTIPDTKIVHMYPVSQAERHVLYFDICICEPEVEATDNGGLLVKHHQLPDDDDRDT